MIINNCFIFAKTAVDREHPNVIKYISYYDMQRNVIVCDRPNPYPNQTYPDVYLVGGKGTTSEDAVVVAKCTYAPATYKVMNGYGYVEECTIQDLMGNTTGNNSVMAERCRRLDMQMSQRNLINATIVNGDNGKYIRLKQGTLPEFSGHGSHKIKPVANIPNCCVVFRKSYYMQNHGYVESSDLDLAYRISAQSAVEVYKSQIRKLGFRGVEHDHSPMVDIAKGSEICGTSFDSAHQQFSIPYDGDAISVIAMTYEEDNKPVLPGDTVYAVITDVSIEDSGSIGKFGIRFFHTQAKAEECFMARLQRFAKYVPDLVTQYGATPRPFVDQGNIHGVITHFERRLDHNRYLRKHIALALQRVTLDKDKVCSI